MSDNIKNLNMK